MPEAPAPGRRNHRHRRRWPLVAAAVLAVLLLAVGAAVTWHFSSAVLTPDHGEWRAAVDVEAVEPGRITLAHSDEADRPGIYGLVWPAGHAIVGPILRSDDDTVVRRLSDVSGYLVPGVDAGFDSDVFVGDPGQARGVPFADVTIDGELGGMPAWEVPAGDGRRRGDWAIVVHGMNGTPQEGLRLLPALRRAGLTSLLITYRDDLGAPSSPDGLHHLGQTEWKDLEAGARYAQDHGARRLVLIGYSMGGAVVTQFMQRSPLAERVAALVLDAPALDWRKVIEFNATEMGLPGFSAIPVEWAVKARIDADWESLDALEHTEDFQLPILLFHGEDDEVVPIETSDEFAAELPGRVTYFRVPAAGHTQGWNVEPRLYDQRMRDFLVKALDLDEAPQTDRARPRGPGSTS